MTSFLGTGLLGANFVRAMLKRGEEVHVWNRTATKATAAPTWAGRVLTAARSLRC